MKYLSENFRKNMCCHFEFEHEIEKMVGIQEVIHIKQIIQKLKKKFYPLFINGMGSWIFFRTSLVPSITHILVIKIAWAVSDKIRFFDFSKFVHSFCKKIFFMFS